jgi:hypothetical protein
MINPKTTVRGGYGMFFDPAEGKPADLSLNPPFVLEFFGSDFDPGNNGRIPGSWFFSDPAPPPVVAPPSDLSGYTGTTHNYDRHLQRGYLENYNVALQHQFPKGILAEAAYVGSQGHKLLYGFNINQDRPGPNGTTIPAPFPNIPAQVVSRRAVGNSVYHSGQFKAEKRFSQGVFLLATYTWSKSIDDSPSEFLDFGSVQNQFDPRSSRGLSEFDVTHRFGLSYVWEIPFGKGKRWGSDANPFLRGVFGNWQTTALFVARSGTPFTVTVGSQIPGGDARPNVIGDPELPKSQRTVDHWFNTAAFVPNCDVPLNPDNTCPGNLLPGDASRGILRGPGYVNLDVGLMKFIKLTETKRLQFRAEAFNVANTPHFFNPVESMQDPNFGKITEGAHTQSFGETQRTFSNRELQLAIKFEF